MAVDLSRRNIQSPAQVRALTDHMRQVRPDILIAVDQEGGRVQRSAKEGFTYCLLWVDLASYTKTNLNVP